MRAGGARGENKRMEIRVRELKRQQLEHLAKHRDALRTSPHLRWLFFEITNRCNLHCGHCGSSCTGRGESLTWEQMERVLTSLEGEKPMICLTGGEPMLHPQIYEMGAGIKKLGFSWGMTTNATLIDDEAARGLCRASLSTVSVSLDGMEQAHDRLRGKRGAWHQAVEGIRSLQRAGFHPQVTTVLHQENLGDLDDLYQLLCEMEIESWRPINIEPIGRACESGGLFLKPDQLVWLLNYIREKRYDPKCPMEVTFGCSHYLGPDYERMVRDHYFLCGAGILVASVRSNGDICACLDIENRPELVQGNIQRDDFLEVWKNRFQAFRRDRTLESKRCQSCPERVLCGGDSAHTWDYEKKEPLLCFREFAPFL